MMQAIPGTLIVAAVPIGCPRDASPRLAESLAAAQVIAAEDTRTLRRLAADLGVRITAAVVSCYDAVERQRTERLLADLRAGRDVLLVTEAGLPCVSDPGYLLVRAAAAAGIRVTALPGPSAVTTALAVSGLPSDRFCFEGFAPRRAGDRARRFAELAAEHRTLVFFESPRRLSVTLAELAVAFGRERSAVVCRELTKTHEEICRGSLGDLADWAAAGVRGEVTIVVGGCPDRHRGHQGTAGQRRAGGPADGAPSGADIASVVAGWQQAGLSKKAAIAAVAAELGLPRRVVYDAVIGR
jgi:16S rRNA (cytidine1402-2'-O)-methyltransferase